jgi:hypothetical protein
MRANHGERISQHRKPSTVERVYVDAALISKPLGEPPVVIGLDGIICLRIHDLNAFPANSVCMSLIVSRPSEYSRWFVRESLVGMIAERGRIF